MDDIGNGYFVHMHFLYQVPSTTKYSTHTVITFATLTKALTTNNNFLKSGLVVVMVHHHYATTTIIITATLKKAVTTTTTPGVHKNVNCLRDFFRATNCLKKCFV